MGKPADLARFLLKFGYSKEKVHGWLAYHLGRKVELRGIDDLANKTYLALIHSKPGKGYYYDLLKLWSRIRNFIVFGEDGD
jgi:hypothetical protein